MDCPLLPGLPTDLAMLCLAKLPIDAVARGRAVSRAFASALRHYPPLGRLPQGLAAFYTIANDNSMAWLFLSRHPDLRSLVVPFSLSKGGNDGARKYNPRLQVIGTGTPLMLVRSRLQYRSPHMPCILGTSDCPGIVEDGCLVQGPCCLQGFDVWQMKWLNPRATPWDPMPVDRWYFAAAHFGKHVYFAGGEGARDAACSAERLSLDTWTWETLPPMRRERACRPFAFAIGGRLVVVEGELNGHSGEFYDPTTNAWTLVPEIWPPDLWWDFGGPESVAVVKDVAYAMNYDLQALVQLKMDSPSFTNFKWHGVGQFPSSAGCKEILEWSYLLSVQDELWAVGSCDGHDTEVFSCKPHLDNGELHWERVYNVSHSLYGDTVIST